MKRIGWIAAALAGVLGIVFSVAFHPAPRLIWNASASVPIGLYAVHPAGVLHVAELLVVRPPEPLANFLDQRRYLPNRVALLKHVLALPGQTVGRSGRTITVDGVAMGGALDRDHLGRPLPVWQGCRVVATGDVFLMNREPPDSLDGRYFGPLSTTTIVGRADPLWTDRSTDRVAAQPQNIATPVDGLAGFIAEASQRFGIPASWIRAVMAVESVGEVRALSSKGAMGLMQIMPDA